MSITPIKRILIFFLLIFFICRSMAAPGTSGLNNPSDSISGGLVISNDTTDGFCISSSGKSVPMLVSSADYPGVIRATSDLQRDIDAVTHAKPVLFLDTIPRERRILIAGTIGSPIIDKLVSSGLLPADIGGKWETFRIQVIKNPFPGVAEATRGVLFMEYMNSPKR